MCTNELNTMLYELVGHVHTMHERSKQSTAAMQEFTLQLQIQIETMVAQFRGVVKVIADHESRLTALESK